HVGTRCRLADAEEVIQLMYGEPAVSHHERAHFRIRRHPAADGQHREIQEHTSERGRVIHRRSRSRFFIAPRKPYHVTARPPTIKSTRGTDMCRRLTHTTVITRNTRSAAPDSDRRPSFAVVAKMRPTAAGATP